VEVTTFIEDLRNLEFTAQRFPKLYSLVLLVKVVRRQSGDLGSEVSTMVGSRLLECTTKERS
jgi:hypothetical protein